jgi:hypothetical protein
MKGLLYSHDDFEQLIKLATQQAVMGLVSQGLMDSGIRLERKDALNLFAQQQAIRHQNMILDDAVVKLCQEMDRRDIRIFVFKGQPLARCYPDAGLRQSGDIDFYCHPKDWKKAISYLKDELELSINDLYTEKDVEFTLDGVAYEMHRKLTLFSNPRHCRYWEKVVMPEILAQPYTVAIDGYKVPTLAPTYNVLYVFVHIFQHLISDGIGLRQFCDWAILMDKVIRDIQVEQLEKHLKGLGIMGAFTGLGAVLTDYLGFKEGFFPFKISPEDHQNEEKLMDNIFEMGNFGHNHHYQNKPGIKHGMEHLRKIYKQSRKFGHYAPSEVWWKIPYMFKWWGKKTWKKIAR